MEVGRGRDGDGMEAGWEVGWRSGGMWDVGCGWDGGGLEVGWKWAGSGNLHHFTDGSHFSLVLTAIACWHTLPVRAIPFCPRHPWTAL